MPVRAGTLRDRVTFAALVGTGKSAEGTPTSAWVDQVTRDAELLFEGGGETVMADRLAGKQPVLIRVRRCSETAKITPGWRATVVRGPHAGAVLNIRSAEPSKDRTEMFVRAEGGVAV